MIASAMVLSLAYLGQGFEITYGAVFYVQAAIVLLLCYSVVLTPHRITVCTMRKTYNLRC
jgi:hypothetical protein